MNSKAKGDISVAMVFAALVKAEITVLTPWGDKERYDLVADLRNCFQRVQCKTARIKNGCVVFNTYSVTTKNGKPTVVKYTPKDVDLYMAYCPQNEKIYVLRVTDASSEKASLRIDPPKNGQQKGVKMAVDYEFRGKLQ